MFIFLLNYFVFVEGDDGDDDKYHNDDSCQRDQGSGPIGQSTAANIGNRGVPSTGNVTANPTASNSEVCNLQFAYLVVFVVAEFSASVVLETGIFTGIESLFNNQMFIKKRQRWIAAI